MVEQEREETGAGQAPAGGGTAGEELEALGFEEALERLEATVRRLEEGELGLEEAMRLYEEGVRLRQLCDRRLREAEGRIEQLIESSDGLRIEPLPEGGAAGAGAGASA
ncbi:MAG: exodeoxyribonuclease VII small subunit [Bacillota bacterium]|nr:exodeoxyribonuclease VII small subunit [Bacillota bacterium]MDI3299466.1 exodeoxyribonuclease VII small subunit [Bacillota bacterium]